MSKNNGVDSDMSYAPPLFWFCQCFTFAKPGPLPGRCSGWLCGPPQVCVVRWAPEHTQSRASLTGRWDPLRWSLSQLSERSSMLFYDSTYKPVNHLQYRGKKPKRDKIREVGQPRFLAESSLNYCTLKRSIAKCLGSKIDLIIRIAKIIVSQRM